MAHSLSAPSKRISGPRFRIDLMPYLFILPAVVIYVIFNLGPVLASFFLSFSAGICCRRPLSSSA